VIHDLRQAVRALRKNPGFTITALITLSLAIGANSAIFTLANALIFAGMPVSHPERLLEVSTLDAKGEQGNLSIPAFQAIRQQTGVFATVLAWNGGGMENLEMNGAAFAGSVDEIAGDYYETLGIRPALGRFITREEIGLEHFTPSAVAVIGYRAWQERYHGDPAALGKTVAIDGKPYQIVGVHPRSFPGLVREAAADATVPVTAYAASAASLYDRTKDYYTVIARLRDGVDAAQARARMEVVWPEIRQATAPDAAPEREIFLARRIQVEAAARGISYLRKEFTRPLYVLFGIVALLLLLACVNLASVALARSHGRAAEFSVRAALGATRGHLLRASFAESILLAMGGAIPGLAFAWWGGSYLAHFIWRGYVPLALSLAPDARVVLFTTAAATAAGVLSGMAPAWRAASHAGDGIRQAGTRVTGGLGLAGKGLVALQIALSFAILAGALILSRSLMNLLGRDPGYRADRLLVAQLFPRSTYKGFDNPAYFRQLLASLQSIPGVTAATFAHDRPVALAWKQRIMPAGVNATYHLVAPGFFDTLGMRILRGREFDLHDDESRPLAAIVSAGLARLLAPSGDAIGQRVRIGEKKTEFEIVGIASDATLDDPRVPNAPAIYGASFQRPDWLGWSAAIVRTPGDPARLGPALRARIESLGREYPLLIETVDREVDRILLPERVLALLTSFFGALGLLLAAVGLYGLLSYTVSLRTREIGVRVALGASRGAIAGLVLRDVALLLAIGLAGGLALAWTGARAIAAFLYGLSSHDPAALGATAGVLLVVAVCASLMPSVRAARVDPVVALRHE
jgi:predicted permease